MSFHVLQFPPPFISSIYQYFICGISAGNSLIPFHVLQFPSPFIPSIYKHFICGISAGNPLISFHTLQLTSAGNPLVDQILPLQFEHLLPDVVLYPLPFIDSFQLPTFVCSDLIVILQSNGTDCCKY